MLLWNSPASLQTNACSELSGCRGQCVLEVVRMLSVDDVESPLTGKTSQLTSARAEAAASTYCEGAFEGFVLSQAATPGLLTPTFCKRQPTSNEVPNRKRRSPCPVPTRVLELSPTNTGILGTMNRPSRPKRHG